MVGRGDRSGSHRNVCVKGETNISDGRFWINTCPTYAQMSITSMNSNSPLLHSGISTSPISLTRRQEHNPRREENAICSHVQKPFSQAEPFRSCSVSLQGLRYWWNYVLHSTKASPQLHTVFTPLSISMFLPLHLWTLYYVFSGVVIPSSNALPLSLQNICQKVIGRTSWQEGSSYTQPLPLAALIFTVLWLRTRRLLVFIRKVLECIDWVGKTNETNFSHGDPLVTYFWSVYQRQKTNSKEEGTKYNPTD